MGTTRITIHHRHIAALPGMAPKAAAPNVPNAVSGHVTATMKIAPGERADLDGQVFTLRDRLAERCLHMNLKRP